MNVSYGFGLFIFTGLPLLIFHFWALLDLLKTSTSQWERAEQNQLVWAIVIIVLFAIGPILYVTMARPKLLAASESASG